MSANKVLEIARREIGIKQTAAGIKYNDAYYSPQKGRLDAWCATFLYWLFQAAGIPELYYGGGKTAYCPTLQDYYKKQGQAVVGSYQPGDIIFFDFNANKIPDHVGLCESFDGTYITTIDGNTSSTSEANGGTVARKRRHKKYICGAARPWSDSIKKEGNLVSVNVPVLKKGSTGHPVKALQSLLTQAGYDTKGIDGSWGTNTDTAFRAWQKAAGLTVDGSCGPASWNKLLCG